MKKVIISIVGIVLITGAVLLNSLKSSSDTKDPYSDSSADIQDSAEKQEVPSEGSENEVTYYDGYEEGSVEYKQSGWIKGEGTELKESRVEFLEKDYMNAQYAWNAAYEYGMSSAGEFFIYDHYDMETEEWIGYVVKIREVSN